MPILKFCSPFLETRCQFCFLFLEDKCQFCSPFGIEVLWYTDSCSAYMQYQYHTVDSHISQISNKGQKYTSNIYGDWFVMCVKVSPCTPHLMLDT